jgi:flagellar biosynthetic protein FliQ
MNEAMVLDIGRQALEVTLLIALPLLLISLITGLLISLFQVATSLQDVTLTFVPKILAVGVTMLLAGHWMLRLLLDYTRNLLVHLPEILG